MAEALAWVRVHGLAASSVLCLAPVHEPECSGSGDCDSGLHPFPTARAATTYVNG